MNFDAIQLNVESVVLEVLAIRVINAVICAPVNGTFPTYRLIQSGIAKLE